MLHTRELNALKLQDTWVTIGTFDGVHLGHQYLIQNLVQEAHRAGEAAVVVTFDPHPAVVLSGKEFPLYLTSPEQKAEEIEKLGVDVLLSYPFNRETAAMSPAAFMERLDASLAIRELWIGYDFALGKDRKGTPERLEEIGRKLGYTLRQISPYHRDGQVISSSQIRKLLKEGNVELAAAYLGRPHRLEGVVVEGDKRGKALGFPTANLAISPYLAEIQSGVYACYAHISGERWKAVTNIGVRPTFENQPVLPRVEAHLLDFNRDLYGKTISLELISFLRKERKFSGVDGLILQVKRDIQEARQVLA